MMICYSNLYKMSEGYDDLFMPGINDLILKTTNTLYGM